MSDETFFSQLPEVTHFADVVSTRFHHDVPDDWLIVITDVRGSTAAIEAGRYRDVNALGVASILALRNALSDVDLPFVFGGDGATVLIPKSRLEQAEAALRGVRKLAEQVFHLKLRVSRVAVAEVREFGHPVRLARYRQSEHVALAALAGRGYSVAEEWIKDPARGVRYAVSEEGPSEADFSGFECRWQPVRAKRGKIVSLLAVAVEATSDSREATYAEVLRRLDEHGCLANLPPFEQSQMKLRGLFADYSVEAKVRSQSSSGKEFENVKNAARNSTQIGRLLVLSGKTAGGFSGTDYRRQFLENTDFRKFDEALRLVLDLNDQQRGAVETTLKQLHAERRLAYGMHLSDHALITCMVGGYDGDHVHFVDGAEGGYALAAKPLKAQLAALKRLSKLPAAL